MSPCLDQELKSAEWTLEHFQCLQFETLELSKQTDKQ